MDIPRIFNITESAHRIHNPITPEKLATLGAALRLESGVRVLDLGSGSPVNETGFPRSIKRN
jgi:tRNA A58 N-methylase Trm61